MTSRKPEFSEGSGGPAFPVNGGIHENQCNGISIRDYFAAQALAGYCANEAADASSRERARWSYEDADAMLEAREGGAS